MEPNKLEQDIKQKLDGRTIKPSPMAWDRLDAMLTVAEQQEEKVIPVKKSNRGWLYMAASVVVLIGLGMFFLNRQDNGSGVINTGNTPQVVTAEPTETTTPAATNDTPAVETTTTTPAKPVYAVTKGKRKQIPVPFSCGGLVAPAEVDPVKQEIAQNTQQTQVQPKEQVAPASNKLKVDPNALLASVEGKTPQDNSAVAASINQPKLKVNSNALLNSVEGELDESFRNKVINSVQKNYNVVKSAVATRNLQ
ncbi:hypothetical protein ACLI1A_00685 [Flavobacterium sp. RHBU_3]|uniref:hypothetical protein n=1 Tax=Flavobacterium sp. RHBU_3 TaxID=3391184 RepID=UPI0039853CE0